MSENATRNRSREDVRRYNTAWVKKRRAEDPEYNKRSLDAVKKWRQSPKGRLFQYKRDAKKDGREWQLTDEEATFMFRSSCHYCGTQPKTSGGIDRKDNERGYVRDNTVPCCRKCNTAKRQRSYAEFMQWIDRIKENTKNK